MHLKSIELSGFKSFARKSTLNFSSPISGVVGPNGSGKSNAAEAFRFVLGEQSVKAMRGKRGPDLIWAGNDRHPQANRARVALTFDNTNHLFDIDFDEVVIERTVHRDGTNEYTINASKVRLKDIVALLSKAHIGASGHHIISQGEADRILGASAKERREMIEEALGLKTYHYKKEESEKKLSTTEENMKEAHLLERELKPQLAHIQRQMQKLERTRALKRDLIEHYTTYIGSQRLYVRTEERSLANEERRATEEIEKLRKDLVKEENITEQSDAYTQELDILDKRDHELSKQKSELLFERGKLEGQLEAFRASETEEVQAVSDRERNIPYTHIVHFLTRMERRLNDAYSQSDVSILEELIEHIHSFLDSLSTDTIKTKKGNNNINSLEQCEKREKKLKNVDEVLVALVSEESAVKVARENVLTAVREHQDKERQVQAQYFEVKDTIRIAEHSMKDIERQKEALTNIRSELKRIEYNAQDHGIVNIQQKQTLTHSQSDLAEIRREIARIEARLEETGVVDESVAQQYKDLHDRMEFIKREVSDLERSKQSLTNILTSLDNELSSRFNEGLEKINKEFQTFFAMLFDGGEASLTLTTLKQKRDEGEDEQPKDIKQGIEVHVQLPRKKVTTLEVLSGGERALTSIALIFAMSQVTPPPFIILDETDAALDEANSRRYADMVRALSKRSQLILITHNRQTMEAAGELYGVTMGSDGVSKLLSVKFDEAVQVAK